MDARQTEFLFCYSLCAFVGCLHMENRSLPKRLFGFPTAQFDWLVTDNVLLVGLFRWLESTVASTTSVPGFILVAFDALLSIKWPLLLDNFLRSCPSAFFFNHSLFSIEASLFLVRQNVYVDHAYLILEGSFWMAWLGSEALDKLY